MSDPIYRVQSDKGSEFEVSWRSEAGDKPPTRVAKVDDALSADAAYRRLRRGEFLLYTGDHRNALQLLSAVTRRLEKHPPRVSRSAGLAQLFRAERDAKLTEHHTLSRLLVMLEADYRLPLRRAPDVREACAQVWGPPAGTRPLVSLRQLRGMMGTAEWRRKGVSIAALGGVIRPHYGVFSPTRQEYLQLIVEAPSPEGRAVFDVGTGTGVLALLLAKRGAASVVATDSDPRAVACAIDNVQQLGLADRIRIEQADLFPDGTADLIVCNPPWIPEQPKTPIERAIYDPDHAFLRRFIAGVSQHLRPQGEVWLIISDLAERLGLRAPDFLTTLFSDANLQVQWQREIEPKHPKAHDPGDRLHEARSRERTHLYALTPRP